MDKRNIKSMGSDSMEEDDNTELQIGKKGQKGGFVSKRFSRKRFIIINRREAMNGTVTYTLQPVSPDEDDSDRIILVGNTFEIRDTDDTYYLSPFRMHGEHVEHFESDDEEMADEAPLSRGKAEKEKQKEKAERDSEKMEIAELVSGPSTPSAVQPIVALVIGGKAQALSEDSKDGLAWACYCANKLGPLATLRTVVMRQRRAEDIGGWVGMQTGSSKKDFSDVAILVTSDKDTTYSYKQHIIYIRKASSQYDYLHQVIFELCNAARRADWARLDTAAHDGHIGCVAYVYAKEALEFLTEQAHDAILEDIQAEAGSRDREVRRNTPVKTSSALTEYRYDADGTSSIDRLRAQIKSKHSEGYIGQWAEDFLPAYMHRNPAAKAAYTEWLTKKGKVVDEAEEITMLGISGLTKNMSEIKLVLAAVATWGEYLLDCIGKMK